MGRASKRAIPSETTASRLALGNVGRRIRDAERETMVAVRIGARAAWRYCAKTLCRVAAFGRKDETRSNSGSHH